jgi:citronellol/citronellal dehydrogenase
MPPQGSETMKPTPTLRGKTLFITGASRGIGLAIALRAARDGANIVIAAKTAEPHASLPGTIHSAAEQVQAAGGQALPVQVDVRDEASVLAAVAQAAARFGGIDILINNASAISLTKTEDTPMKRFDLMMGVNVRGTFLCTQACLPHLKKSSLNKRNPHILNLSPPLAMKSHWFEKHTAYSISKYGMSECTLGHAAEFRPYGIAVNSLWPRTAIDTDALRMIPGIDTARCRKPQIVAYAAHAILCLDSSWATGQFLIDDAVLAQEGVVDFDIYSVTPGTKDFVQDFFVD